jgi:hypothetical protein
MKFQANQFTATKWDSAQDKAEFVSQFQKFVKSDFAANHFADWFYRRLCMTFGHIAHYSRSGFWDEFFTTTADKVRFIEQSLQYPCHGDPAWTYSDVEIALQDWLKKERILEAYRQMLADETESAERAELARLQQKYGPVV